MLDKGAYLHQYTKFGLEEDQIVDCFYKFEKIVQDYSNI